MLPHPFTESLYSKIIGSSLIVIAIAIQWGLLVVYGNSTPVPALIDSFISVFFLAIAGYLAWYILSFVQIWQTQILIALVVQFICLGVSLMILSLFRIEDINIFLKSLPLRFLFGLLSWIILLQWYWMMQKDEQIETKLTERVMGEEAPSREEYIDRISVKDGSRIHIIHLDDLICIQASGDYVTLFTDSGQYIKEQTMKYYEISLPPTGFVRIHRSSIVNTEHIMRVELFGKETYQVRLKNGMSLRASNSGYKLLKERLAL